MGDLRMRIGAGMTRIKRRPGNAIDTARDTSRRPDRMNSANQRTSRSTPRNLVANRLRRDGFAFRLGE
jgi:hypothetical protein